MLALMQATGINATVRVDREALDRLRRANNITSEAELARRIGVNETTLWRVSKGDVVPSTGFIAGVLLAFPGIPFAEVFKAERKAA